MAAPGTVTTIPTSIADSPREGMRLHGGYCYCLLDQLEQQITRDGGTWATKKAALQAAGIPTDEAEIIANAKNIDPVKEAIPVLLGELSAYKDIAGE